MSKKHYDVIVIGSGGGSKITRPAAALGYKVAIIENGFLGGTCLNHGCIPSKMVIHPADMLAEFDEAYRFEFSDISKPKIKFEELITRVTTSITKDSNSIKPLYDNIDNITLYQESASFLDTHTLKVGKHTLTSDKIFIVAGARAHIPNIPGLKGTPYFTYKEALRNTTLPKKMIIVGGGYIAVELGYFYGMMGCEVSFLVRNRMIKNEDHEVIDAFEKEFSKRFAVHFKSKPLSVNYENNTFTVDIDSNGNRKQLQADALFIATGVTPNTDTLNVHKAGINVDEKGFIPVNNKFETNCKHIWAFGDIIGEHLFRHAANYQGEYLFNHVFKNQVAPIKYPPMPHAIFTNPQVAGVGPTENELKEKNIDYVVGKNDYNQSAMGMALLSNHGFAKLLFDKQTHQLLAAHIIGKEASNMIHMAIAYIKMKATLEDMLDTIYIHPALPEIVRNAVRKAHQELLKCEPS